MKDYKPEWVEIDEGKVSRRRVPDCPNIRELIDELRIEGIRTDGKELEGFSPAEAGRLAERLGYTLPTDTAYIELSNRFGDVADKQELVRETDGGNSTGRTLLVTEGEIGTDVRRNEKGGGSGDIFMYSPGFRLYQPEGVLSVLGERVPFSKLKEGMRFKHYLGTDLNPTETVWLVKIEKGETPGKNRLHFSREEDGNPEEAEYHLYAKDAKRYVLSP